VLGRGEIFRRDDLPLAPDHGNPGAAATFAVSYGPLRDDVGRIAGVIITAIETTARVRAEAALGESEARVRTLVEARSEVLYRMGPDWSEMREVSGGGFIADTQGPSRAWLEEYIHPDDRPHVMAAIAQAVRTKSVFEIEHRVRRVDGSLGWRSRGRCRTWLRMARLDSATVM
jgi:PAS domain-containing protein